MYKTGNDVFLMPILDAIASTSILTNETLGHNNLTLQDLTLPEISANNGGDIIYVRNVAPISRQIGQTEQVKLYFGF